MPTVKFVEDGITVEVPKGTPLAEIVDDEGVGVPFGCRDGVCGTCMLVVREGGASFQKMSPDERETIEMNDGDPGVNRLCCQAIVNGDMVVDPI